MTVSENYIHLQENIAQIARKCGRDPSEISLVAVTKKHNVDNLMPAYQAGCRDFGENRLQEALLKIPKLPPALRWHFIGTLQKNKVRKVIGQFALIHSVDTMDLATKISQCSEERGLVTPILLQANTSGEEGKHGLAPEEWKNCFEEVRQLPGITIEGLMTMAPFVENVDVVRSCFAKLRYLRDELCVLCNDTTVIPHLSMGMTHDYPLAIEEGATILRIGTAIFGERMT